MQTIASSTQYSSWPPSTFFGNSESERCALEAAIPDELNTVTPVVIYKAGIVGEVSSLAEAKRLAEEAHAGYGWTWGVLVVKK